MSAARILAFPAPRVASKQRWSGLATAPGKRCCRFSDECPSLRREFAPHCLKANAQICLLPPSQDKATIDVTNRLRELLETAEVELIHTLDLLEPQPSDACNFADFTQAPEVRVLLCFICTGISDNEK